MWLYRCCNWITVAKDKMKLEIVEGKNWPQVTGGIMRTTLDHNFLRPAWNSSEAPVARSEWLVLCPPICASLHMFFSIEPRMFFPTGTLAYHGSFGSEGTLMSGLA